MTPTRDLIQRRVPQYLAIYIGVAWGVVQFVSFLEERYTLSPHLTDLTLLTFALLLPSAVLFTYNHGRPGRDRWLLLEKVGIPINVLGALVVLYLVFGGKELGALTDQVVIEDETGQAVERAVPRASFRTRLALFNFDTPASDTASAWLQYALPIAVATDLAQNMFLDVRVSAYFREKLRQVGFNEGINIPLGLKQSIAQEQHLPYFTSARITRSGDQITISLALYETSRAAAVRERTFTDTDVLALSDQISAALAEDMGLPPSSQAKDLPASELLSTSPDAFRHYSDGLSALQFRDQWPQAIEQLERAVAIDSTFAAAWAALHSVYLLANQPERSMPPLKNAMDLIYRLPERSHYDLKAEYYFMNGERDKAIAVARMKVELYPEDIAGYLLLSQFQRMANDRTGMIESLRRVLELDPAQQEMLQQIGALYEEIGDFDNASSYYAQYAERFPAKAEAQLSLADLYRSRGDHEAARRHYERALLISTGNVTALVEFARLERGLGRFDSALQLLAQASAAARSTEDRARALAALAAHYEFRGQLNRALEYRAQESKESATATPPLVLATRQLQQLGGLVRAGQTETARRTLARVATQLKPPFDVFAAVGEMQLELALENADAAERAIPGVEGAIQASGFQFLHNDIVYARGRIAEMRGNCAEAITHYQQSRELQPWDAIIHYNIGRCHRKLGQLDQSIEQHRRTLDVLPFHGPANYEIGLTYLEAGDRTRALEHLRRASEVWSDADPSYRMAAEAKAKLREVESRGT